MSAHHQHHKYRFWDHKHRVVGWWKQFQLLDDLGPETQATKVTKHLDMLFPEPTGRTRRSRNDKDQPSHDNDIQPTVQWHGLARDKTALYGWMATVKGLVGLSVQSVCPVCLSSIRDTAATTSPDRHGTILTYCNNYTKIIDNINYIISVYLTFTDTFVELHTFLSYTTGTSLT